MNRKLLTKNTAKKKYKKVVNTFGDGGTSKFTQTSIDTAKNAFSGANLGGTLSAIGSGISGIAEATIANAKTNTTEADNAIEAVNNYEPATSSLDALANSYSSLNFASTDYNHKDFMVGTGKGLANMGTAALSGATAGATIGGPWGAVIGGAAGLLGSGAGWIAGALKSKEEEKRLEKEALFANSSAQARAVDARDDIMLNEYNNYMKNVAARGGQLRIRGNLFNNGGTMHQHGGIFSNGITFVDSGGTHEQNPFEGVQIGVDYEGIPNMVEEGELIWNDYVFSNRLKPTKEFKKKYKVKGNTFADVAKEMQKESEERPNDPISKTGLEDSMIKLMIEQEGMRQRDSKKGRKKLFGDGGPTDLENLIQSYLKSLGVEHMPNTGESIKNDILNKYDTVVTEEPVVEDDSYIDAFWGAAKTPEQRLAVMSLDPDNPAKKQNLNPDLNSGSGSGSGWVNLVRYMPAIGSGIAAITDAFGLTNKPDYSNVEVVKKSTDDIKPIEYTPINDRLIYTPFDTQFYAAKLAEQNAATKRAIVNSALTGSAATAGLLAADYNSVGKIGDLYRQAEEYNQAQREKVAGFNRQTNTTNSEMGLKAAMANQNLDELKLKSAITQAQMRNQTESQASAGKSANLTNLFDNLGAIGKESYIMQMVENNPALLYDWMGRYKNSNACGGMLTKRRRRK